ncbi:unnamed protein product [Blepharisma stoltei]|uniref:S-adenosylmethionine-dependent methyltransferase At5g38100 n=1 Tax=Blepharisma stoltei TaxID=1481888 RepID=A0AAU9JAD9_9CILI|nr:unnamed protein product [Blepharisma stoltei]
METGGFALQNYNVSSSHQRKILMAAKDAFTEILNHTKTITNGKIVIADYGCSEGKNSMEFLFFTLKKFRENSSQSVFIIHNDLPENDWVKAYKTLLESQESYIKIPDVYFSAIGRSFYSQILPNNSLHIGFSSASIHWLSQPLCAPDHAFPSSSDDLGFLETASNIAHNDLVTFLRHRHQELVDSGRLLLQFGDRNAKDTVLTMILQAACENLYNKGIITDEEKRKITIPMYRRSNEEIIRALDEVSGLFRVVSIDRIRTEWNTSDSEEEWKESVNQVKKFIGNLMRIPMSKAINRSGENFEAIFLEFSKEVDSLAESACAEYCIATYHSIVLEKIK